ncbi:MAG TPA: lysylphosphatidylglycerol synthase transmembrane domain-containing protein [Isosphaeraceae bacterium]|jgi:hypothetical protein|nr:lysylphosphatidylglycerol synthase transmembrane domain-containing protein [Isosphaeraceae bacterium]
MTTHDRQPRPRARFGTLLRFAVAFGLLGLVMYLNRRDLRDVLSRSPDFSRLAAAFGLYALGVWLSFTRWYVLARALGLPLPYIEAVRLGCVAHFFNLMLPGQVGGDFVKAAYLLKADVKRGHAVASIALNILMNLLGLFVLAVVAGLLAWGHLEAPGRRLVALAGVFLAATLALIALGLTPGFYRLLGRRRKRPGRLAEWAEAAGIFRRRPLVLLVAAAMAALSHVGNILAFAQVGRALFPSVPSLAEHFLLVPLILFSTAIPLPLGALGASEEISAQLFRLAHYQGGAVVMIGYRLIQYSACLITGSVYLANRGRVRLLVASTDPSFDDEPAAAEALSS